MTKKKHFMMIKGQSVRKTKTITNGYVPNDKVSKSMKPCFTEVIRVAEKSAIIVRDLTAPFLAIDETQRQKNQNGQR